MSAETLRRAIDEIEERAAVRHFRFKAWVRLEAVRLMALGLPAYFTLRDVVLRRARSGRKPWLF